MPFDDQKLAEIGNAIRRALSLFRTDTLDFIMHTIYIALNEIHLVTLLSLFIKKNVVNRFAYVSLV